MLSEMIYMQKGDLHDYIKRDCLNLVRFVETVKNVYWSDWDKEITKSNAN